MGSHTQRMDEEFRSLLFWRAVLAEFVGMALFLFMGVGSTSLFPPTLQGNDVRIALAFGIAIATFVHITAHISGGHLNPAVTLAFFCKFFFLSFCNNIFKNRSYLHLKPSRHCYFTLLLSHINLIKSTIDLQK